MKPSRMLARHLAQQAEAGLGQAFLDGLTATQLVELARLSGSGGSGRDDARPSGSAPGTARPVANQSRGARTQRASAAAAGRAAATYGPAAGAELARGGGTREPHGHQATTPGFDPGAGAARRASERRHPAPGYDQAAELPSLAPEDLPADHDELRALALSCTRCRLAGERTQVVFNDGPSAAEVMVVGEAPGAREDATGLPFVGPAGRLLDLILATVGLSRSESVYIANVLKCRPPGNRNPLADEIESCSPFLLRQIQVVKPRIILAAGAFAGRLLTGRERVPLSKLRGRLHSYMDLPLVVTYHPAALLRNPGWVRATWEDVQLLASELRRG